MSPQRGFFIALESFETFNPPMRLFSEHLTSNIAAYLALKGYPPVPISLLCGEPNALDDDQVEIFPLSEDATALVFDPIEGFIAPRETVSQELERGRIVITDRFLHHVDAAMPTAHLGLPVEKLFFEGETQADCVIYVPREGAVYTSEMSRHADAALRAMSQARSNVALVSLVDQHMDTCDAIWKAVKQCLKPWLESQFGERPHI